MDRTRAIVLVAGVLLTLLFVTVSTAEPARIADRQPSLPWELPTLDLGAAVPTTTIGDGIDTDERTPPRAWEIFVDALQWALLAGVLFLILRQLARLWAMRPQFKWVRRPGPHRFEALDELAAAVITDAAAQQAALRSGEARNAIVECWLRLEALVEDAGIAHDPALTSAEFTSAVLARFRIDPEPANRLAALYREARFSAHPMGEDDRAAAITALGAIHEGLRAASTSVASS